MCLPLVLFQIYNISNMCVSEIIALYTLICTYDCNFVSSVDSPANLHWPTPSHHTLTQPWTLHPGPTQLQPLYSDPYSTQPRALYQYRHQPPYPTPPHTLNPDPRSGHYQPSSHPIPPRVTYHGTRVEYSQPAGKYTV